MASQKGKESSEIECIREECEGRIECEKCKLRNHVNSWCEHSKEDTFWKHTALKWLDMTDLGMEYCTRVIQMLRKLKEDDLIL
jgi:hypothetical protein